MLKSVLIWHMHKWLKQGPFSSTKEICASRRRRYVAKPAELDVKMIMGLGSLQLHKEHTDALLVQKVLR